MPGHERIAALLREVGAMLGELADEMAPAADSPLNRLTDASIAHRVFGLSETPGRVVFDRPDPPSTEALAEAFGAEHVRHEDSA